MAARIQGKIWWMMKFQYMRTLTTVLSSHEASLEPTIKRREDSGKHSIILISQKTEIATSVRGPKLQGLRAEDAMAKPYLLQKIFVT